MKKRIVVTGMGLVSSLGNDVEILYERLLNGESAVRLIDSFPVDDYQTKFAASVPNFDPEDYLEKKLARRVDPFLKFTLVAGKKALQHAQLDINHLEVLDRNRCGIVVGSGMGGMQFFLDNVKQLIEKGHRRVSPFFIPYIITNMASGLLAIDTGFMGPNYSISTACATGNNSIIAAAQHIQNGEADLMVCGGVEAAVNPIGLAGFCSCKALSTRNDEPTKASRPWDMQRDGFVMGEGAGVLILESLEHAIKRGAPIYAEYLGGGLSCDAHHITEPRPDGEGVALCVKNALHNAGVSPEQVDYINAHATSTPAGDMAEVNALKKVFKNPNKIVMNGTKSLIGHCLGAAGGIEAIVTIQAIRQKKVHGTLNLENPEPNLEFDCPATTRDLDVNIAISNSFGFGGHNATVVLGAYQS
jgi:3-oxoacyl-[acyl-carrier-protein] synthase II